MNDALVKEMVDRTRRIETKLSRLISGEGDKGVTQVVHKLDRINEGEWQLHLHSLNITLIQLGGLIAPVPDGDEVDIYDDGRYIMTVMVR
jgi:hypothetical protein